MSLINIFLILIWLFAVPFMIGMLMNHVFWETEDISIPKSYVFGFAGMCFVFEIMAPEMILLSVPFTGLKYSYMLAVLVLSLLSVIVCRKNYKKLLSSFEFKHDFQDKLSVFIWVAAVLVIAFQVILVTVFRHIDTDDARFVAEAVEAIERNTMLKYHPITGRFFDYPIGETFKDVMSPFPMFLAAISSLLHLPPAICAHTVLPGVFVIMSYAVFYLIGKFFLHDCQRVGAFMFFLSLIVMFSFESIYSYGYTLLSVIWQGRSFMCMILIPLLSYCMISFCEIERLRLKHYLLVVVILLANIMASGMGIILTGMIAGAYAVARGVNKKSFAEFVKACLPILVNFVMLILMKWCQAHCWK